ncbi:tubulin monoglycylase TTLL3 [Lampris incognitus]|uniref:tubulin monoglycylase TTLL3 n=1 Tax=Lampris incognitus TaxID=2546036 RepID=UPI0024B547E0|nr:tubulin monoglycylase TTLL3 [Lampris incognitus]
MTQQQVRPPGKAPDPFGSADKYAVLGCVAAGLSGTDEWKRGAAGTPRSVLVRESRKHPSDQPGGSQLHESSMQHIPLPPVDGRLHRRGLTLPVINPDKLRTAKALVEKAVKLQKVFTVQGPYPVIRSALRARGWIERCLPRAAQRVSNCHGEEEEDGHDGDDSAQVTDGVEDGVKEEDLNDLYDLMSRMVRNETTFFYWTTRRDSIDCRSLRKDQMTNHYANVGTFTTKVGLCVNLRNLQWFDTADPDTFFPRCYKLGAQDEKHAFIEDFRRTACTSLLQYVAETRCYDIGEAEEPKVEDKVAARRDGQTRRRKHAECRSVGPVMIDRALHVCQEFLSRLEHSDIDVSMETPPALTEQQWAEFLQDYGLVVHQGGLIRGGGVFVERCQAMLTRLQKVCPQLDTDGLHNIWIIKPGAKSRGRGIMCMNDLDHILTLVDSDPALIKDSKWVVQKYLERPLLIHDTKFDLRQWFLVTDWNPLTIWFYRECYLRFSTQPYSTKTLDSSVHLCNNSIQKHFLPSPDRHPGLPEDNMWSCSEFRAFLQEQGRGAQWGEVVVPGMQRAVVHALQTAQDLVEGRKASFELYGADFMLGRDLRPWLLEINASPTMACSTAVTSRLCPAVQRDMLRVVLDRQADPSAYTGGFELIYKQAAVEVPHYAGVNLLVEGVPIRRSRSTPHRRPVIADQIVANQHPSDQSPLEEAERTDKSSSHKISTASVCHRSEKENHSDGNRNKKLLSAAPKKEREGRTMCCKNPRSGRRSCQSLAPEQRLMLHTEPQRKARRLGLRFSGIGVPLVPMMLNCHFSPPCRMSDSKPQRNPVFEPQRSRHHLTQTTLKAQCRAPTRGLSPLHGPLPALEVHRLQLNPLAGAIARRCPSHSSPGLTRHQFFPQPHRQTMVKNKGGGTWEHDHK